MATRQTRALARIMTAPSIIVLFVWMIVPLVLTLWYSVQRFNLQHPERAGFVWFRNYYFFLTDPAFLQSISNTLILVVGVLVITVVGGVLLALLETSIAKMRVFRVPEFLGAALMLGLLATLLLFVSRSL